MKSQQIETIPNWIHNFTRRYLQSVPTIKIWHRLPAKTVERPSGLISPTSIPRKCPRTDSLVCKAHKERYNTIADNAITHKNKLNQFRLNLETVRSIVILLYTNHLNHIVSYNKCLRTWIRFPIRNTESVKQSIAYRIWNKCFIDLIVVVVVCVGCLVWVIHISHFKTY